MPVPYTPPDYVPPEQDRASWSGPERRSRDPINQLSRSFNRLCLEASDRFEIVAHLEALGYNSPSALARLGVNDHFELATALYARTPKTFERTRPAMSYDRDWLGAIAMVLTLLVTFMLGAFSTEAVLAPALWILVWSQVASSMLSKADTEIGTERRHEVLGLMMLVGLLGLGASRLVLPYGLEAIAAAVLWFAVASLLWARWPLLALALPIATAVTLAVGDAAGADADLARIVTLTLAGVSTARLLVAATDGALAWAARRARAMLMPALYGVGQAALIVALLRQTPVGADVVPGALLLALILLLARALLLTFKEALTARLWKDTDERSFVAFARLALVGYAAVYLAPVAIAALTRLDGGTQPWHYHWNGFGLFGLCLALAVVSLTLGDIATPGLSFLAAGLAVQVVPFVLVCAALAGLQLIVLLARSARFERYAVYLL